MRNLFCITLTILLSAGVRGQIFLTKEGNATSALGRARKTLIRIAESNMDVFVPTDSAFTMGFVVAREDAAGKTQYEFLCVDTSLQNQITIHPNVLKDIIWKDLSAYQVSPYIIVQPFTFLFSTPSRSPCSGFPCIGDSLSTFTSPIGSFH